MVYTTLSFVPQSPAPLETAYIFLSSPENSPDQELFSPSHQPPPPSSSSYANLTMAQVSSSKLPPNARLVNSPIPPPYSPLTPFANHPSSSTSKTLSAAPNTALLRAEMSGPSPQNQVHFNLKPLFEPFPGYGRPRLGQPYRGFCQAMLKRHR